MSSLKNKTMNGLFWSFTDLILNQGIQFIIQIFLARLILPQEFGLIGMISVFIAVSNSIIDSGFSNALIREKKNTQEDYSTVFYFNLFTAILIYIILYVIAPSIALFFGQEELILIVRVISLTLIVNSFGMIQRTILIKKINFKIQMKINLIASVVSGGVAIILAINGFGVWSLVIRSIVMQLIQSILLIKSYKWLPSLVFSVSSFKKLFGFGWKLMVSSLINTLYDNLYYLVIGKVFSAKDLGYYTNAQKLRDMASTSITSAIQKVSYPVLSEFQEDNEKLKEMYIKIVKNTVFLIFPVMIGLIVVAEPLILIIFGVKWSESIIYFQILCLAGILFPLHAINLNILQVKGKSDLFLKLEILKKAIGIILIVLVVVLKMGILGLIWTAVISSVISYFINSYFSKELINYSTIDQLKDIAPVVLASAIMMICVYTTNLIIFNNLILELFFKILFGVVLYIILCKILKIKELDNLINSIKNR